MSKKGENIYKRKDGRWEARYIKGYRTNGTAHYGYCYARTYLEVKEKVGQARAALLNRQETMRGTRKRLAFYCEEWLCLKRSCVKESTYVKYEAVLRKYIKPELGKHYTDTLSEVLLEQFGYDLLHREQLSVKTVRDILSILRAILDYAVRQNPLLRPLTIVYPKESQKEMRVLTDDEQKRFAGYLLGSMDECRFGVLLALLTGLRIGEVCALKWSDISLEERTIRIRQTMQRLKNTDDAAKERTRIAFGEPKSSRSARVIPLNDYTAKLCAKWKVNNPAAYILTGSEQIYMEPRTLQYRMKRYAGDCGLEDVHFHTLRHSFATRCVEAGFEIKSLSEILGHSSTRITLNCYVHSSMELKRKNMDKLNEKFDYAPPENTVTPV